MLRAEPSESVDRWNPKLLATNPSCPGEVKSCPHAKLRGSCRVLALLLRLRWSRSLCVLHPPVTLKGTNSNGSLKSQTPIQPLMELPKEAHTPQPHAPQVLRRRELCRKSCPEPQSRKDFRGGSGDFSYVYGLGSRQGLGFLFSLVRVYGIWVFANWCG